MSAHPQHTAAPPHGPPGGQLIPGTKDPTIGYLLCYFLGAHRLYLSDIIGCVVYWLTGGLCCVMTICDTMHMSDLCDLANRGQPLPIIASMK